MLFIGVLQGKLWFMSRVGGMLYSGDRFPSAFSALSRHVSRYFLAIVCNSFVISGHRPALAGHRIIGFCVVFYKPFWSPPRGGGLQRDRGGVQSRRRHVLGQGPLQHSGSHPEFTQNSCSQHVLGLSSAAESGGVQGFRPEPSFSNAFHRCFAKETMVHESHRRHALQW